VRKRLGNIRKQGRRNSTQNPGLPVANSRGGWTSGQGSNSTMRMRLQLLSETACYKAAGASRSFLGSPTHHGPATLPTNVARQARLLLMPESLHLI